VITKTDDKTGTGTYTYTITDDDEDTKPVSLTFKWKDPDKEKKIVVFEMNNKDDMFWKGIKSPATFTYDVTSGMTLTADGKALSVSHPVKDPGPAPPKKAPKKKK
jgi:hypothetical protein